MEFIDQAAKLGEACRIIDASSWAALDTEADSLHHYTERLSLVQVSVTGHDFVFDPLAVPDLQPLIAVLNTKHLILQGADFDIRILRRSFDFRPKEIFDTMIAAQFLGYPKQGLADLAQKHCEVHLPKEHQKADWSQRPLTQEMLDYASNDTHYLKSIEDCLVTELKDLGRLEWHRQSCEKLLLYLLGQKNEKEEDENPWQVRGSKNLKGHALNILKEIWHWRDAEAQRRDRPTFKVLNTDSLLEISEWGAKTPNADVGQMDKAPRHIRGEHRQTFNTMIAKAKTQTPLTWQFPPKKFGFKARWNDTHEKALEQLKAKRETISKELGIQPGVLGNNAALEKCVLGDAGDLLPWQKSLLLS